jgi:type II secretory pathway component PulC
MADKDPLIPERELLKLIEEEKDTPLISSSKVKKGFGFFSLGRLRGKISFLKSKIITSFRSPQFNIKALNKFLAGLFVILFIYVITDIVFSMSNLKEELEDALRIEKKPTASYIEEVVSLKSLDYYLNKVKKRDIFNIIRKEVVKVKKEKKAIEEAVERTKHLKLVGIAWSQDPDAMIEDTRVKKTLFVKEGDRINEIIVEEIQKDKVILNYKGERVELK